MTRFLGLFLSLSLLIQSFSASAAGIETLEKFESGGMGVNKNIARPLSKYALKKMGTPGFMISKFMTYRKIMTGSRCTLSEKMNFAGNILTLAGDITNHVISIKNGRTLKKEFGDKADKVKDYLKDKKDLLMVSKESGEVGDVQLMAIDYSIRSNELELERLKMLRNFKNPALALFLGSTILNAKEALAEASTAGTFVAATNACKTVEKPAQVAQEATIEATSIAAPASNPNEDAPWYVKPFLWIGSTIKSGTKSMDSKKAENVDSYGGIGPLTSANYAEEMIVGVVDHLKKEKKDAGLGDKVKDEAISIATRLLVRQAVKANVVAVDGFMRSSPGRAVVYAYNTWVIYTEFAQLKGDIDDAKTKIAALKEIRADFTSTTTTSIDRQKFRKEFEEVFMTVLSGLISEAHADIADAFAFPPIKMCLGANECSKVGDFVDANSKKSLLSMPEKERNEQISFLKSSYSLAIVNKFTKGEISIQGIDQNRVDAEITQYEVEAEKSVEFLHAKNIVKKDRYLAFEKFAVDSDYKWYAPAMVPDFNSMQMLAYNTSNGPTPRPVAVQKISSVDINETEVSSPEKVAQDSTEKELKEVMKTNFEYEDVNQNVSGSIWDIISMRYQKKKLTN